MSAKSKAFSMPVVLNNEIALPGQEYVDPILFESGFFKDRREHDQFMAGFGQRYAATKQKKRRGQKPALGVHQ